MSETKLMSFLKSKSFLLYSCVAIFLSSIFLRSMVDIGADTGVYIELGKKISAGGKYYYNFFESNFPLSFWFYALEHKISKLLGIHPVILSEIVINLLALASIFWSAKILLKSTISENKAHFNLIVIGFFLGFFLRPDALEIGEFGTKTSLLLILFYPYIAYSFERKIPFTKKDLISRGCLMGLIPCLKPHYLIFMIFIEARNFWQKKSLRFFLEIDKLLMVLLGSLYLVLMMKFTPEFFQFIVWMWPKIYICYDELSRFIGNIWRSLAAKLLPLSFIFLVFSRLKMDANDKILALFFAAACALIILENIGSVDQVTVFYAVATICFLKISFDLFCSKYFSFYQNKFIVLALMILPIFDMKLFPRAIFGLGGFVSFMWILALVYPFYFVKKITISDRKKYFSYKNIALFLLLYSLALLSTVLSLKYLGAWQSIACNLFILFFALFFFEKKLFAKISPTFSPFFVFIIFTSISCLAYAYIQSIVYLSEGRGLSLAQKKFSEPAYYYSKVYAPQKEDGIVAVAPLIQYQFPMLNYLEKDNYQKPNVVGLEALPKTTGQNFMFSTKDPEAFFTNSYLFDDFKKQVLDSRVKVIFFNESSYFRISDSFCTISHLEYYFLDPEFRKIFFENFRFENTVKIKRKVRPSKKVRLISGEEKSIFDQLEPSTIRILHEFEVYVRKEK